MTIKAVLMVFAAALLATGCAGWHGAEDEVGNEEFGVAPGCEDDSGVYDEEGLYEEDGIREEEGPLEVEWS